MTTADKLQEQFEVERLPEVGYHRIGDSFGDDRFTFFSDNTVSGLNFQMSDATLAEQGFRNSQSPGIPSLGQTGTDDDGVTYRGDFRQEVDYPFDAGQFRVVPYVMGRYIPYSDSPTKGMVNRVFGGAGVRMTTAFWKTDDSVHSDLFDIHRLRHVVEPEVHLFTSAQTSDRNDVFIYDENVDDITDVSAVQLALRQRWQTKRGGAGQWRSVDVFTFNVEANFFANEPDDQLPPSGFRGLFFDSLPEASIPRNSINADALWRISDTTALLADEQFNLDEMSLATTSIGLAVQRDTRLSYFVGARYIGQLNSTIASTAINYEMSTKYALQFVESVNLSDRRNQNTTFTLIRKFDRFYITFSVYYDAVEDVSGVRFGLVPLGLSRAVSTDSLNQIFGPQQ